MANETAHSHEHQFRFSLTTHGAGLNWFNLCRVPYWSSPWKWLLACNDSFSPRPRLLVTGCGRSGTHAIASLLRDAGIAAVHEVGMRVDTTALVSWRGLAYMQCDLFLRSQTKVASTSHPNSGRCLAPVLKVHREPLGAISSLANGFNDIGSCYSRDPKHAANDAASWQFVSRFVPLPYWNETAGYQATCGGLMGRRERVVLSLHYWLGWNLLGDAVATHTMAVENATARAIHQLWCEHCTRRQQHATWARPACECPRLDPIDPSKASEPQAAKERKGHDASSVIVHATADAASSALTWAELHSYDSYAAGRAAELAEAYGYQVTMLSNLQPTQRANLRS